MTRKQYSKSDIKKFVEINPFTDSLMNKKSKVVEEEDIIKIDEVVSLIKIDGVWLPHLKVLLSHPNILPKVTVDMGAVKFVVNGADIMRPGITVVEEFQKDDFVTIIDVNNKKSLAVGKALLSSTDMKQQSSGKSIKNCFWVGDKYWGL